MENLGGSEVLRYLVMNGTIKAEASRKVGELKLNVQG